MNVRKSPRHLTQLERNDFIDAAVALKNSQVSLPDGTTIGKYDQHVALHLGVTARLENGVRTVPTDGGHGGPGFLPWHREYLLRIEKDLQDISQNPILAIPFWDWTDPDTTFHLIFKDDFLGEYDNSGIVEVNNARFAQNNSWKLDKRVRVRMVEDLIADPNAQVPEFGENLVREFLATSSLPRSETVEFLMERPNYDSFTVAVEAGTSPHRRTHNFMHSWVGGVMRSHASPYDPIFMLNHAFIDRLWALWQALGRHGDQHYTTNSNAGHGHEIDSNMWPWDGADQVTTVNRIEQVLPDFDRADIRTPRHVLDSCNLDCSYVHWTRVKEILDDAIARWSTERGGIPPRLETIHGAAFGWSSREELLTATAKGMRLIEPTKIGNRQGYQTNLVTALRQGFPRQNIRRMPAGGPEIKLSEIAEIAHWIDMGCPDDQGQVV